MIVSQNVILSDFLFWLHFNMIWTLCMSFKDKIFDLAFDFFDMIAFLVFVWGIVLFVRFFIANPYTVVGESMHPTFEQNDFIIVDKITPRFGDLQRNDVIVFVPPGKTVPYIKRIIGLPGETVKIHDNIVQICTGESACFTLDQSYLPTDFFTDTRCGITNFKILSGYFVMGDNRSFSTDSRCCFWLSCYKWSTYEVPFDHIIGKVYLRMFPQFGVF